MFHRKGKRYNYLYSLPFQYPWWDSNPHCRNFKFRVYCQLDYTGIKKGEMSDSDQTLPCGDDITYLDQKEYFRPTLPPYPRSMSLSPEPTKETSPYAPSFSVTATPIPALPEGTVSLSPPSGDRRVAPP